MNKIYPAIFHKENGVYWVEFPDLNGCITQGETIEEAFAMSKEALALYIDGMQELPKATEMSKIETKDGETVMLVEADNADDIVYNMKSEVPKYIEGGLAAKGLTKNQVAFILNVDRSYLTHIVKGDRVPSVEMAKRIGILLGFDWKVFFPTNDGI